MSSVSDIQICLNVTLQMSGIQGYKQANTYKKLIESYLKILKIKPFPGHSVGDEEWDIDLGVRVKHLSSSFSVAVESPHKALGVSEAIAFFATQNGFSVETSLQAYY